MKIKYSDKEEEWELVATKAEGWLKKKSLPSDLTLELQLRASVHSEEKHVKSTLDFQLIYHLHQVLIQNINILYQNVSDSSIGNH